VCYRAIALVGEVESDPSAFVGDYDCTTPTEYYGGYAEGASISKGGLSSSLNRTTPLLNGGVSKSGLGRAGAAKAPKRFAAPATNRVGGKR
jgi:hypothetical protein